MIDVNFMDDKQIFCSVNLVPLIQQVALQIRIRRIHTGKTNTGNVFLNRGCLGLVCVRVVGVGQECPCARVLWVYPGGAADRAVIRVGDEVCLRYKWMQIVDVFLSLDICLGWSCPFCPQPGTDSPSHRAE